MGGPCTSIYMRDFNEMESLEEIDAIIVQLGTDIKRTRKMKNWSFHLDHRPIDLHIEKTEEALWDCEDELLEKNLLPEDVPYTIVICAGCNDRLDYEAIGKLVETIALKYDCVTTDISK